jgi:hypothetical protein
MTGTVTSGYCQVWPYPEVPKVVTLYGIDYCDRQRKAEWRRKPSEVARDLINDRRPQFAYIRNALQGG